MSSTQTNNEYATQVPSAGTVETKLEVVVIPVSDVDRAKRFYLIMDVATLTELLREAEKHHGEYEPTAPKHHWSDWYAAYFVAREQGRTPEEAANDGALHMERIRR
jgi:catechol 2,3-dioxygenase-like lactoylglutathione lyase family enzyme